MSDHKFRPLDMHPLASRSRLLETEPKLFVVETSYNDMCSMDDIALNLSLCKSKREYS